MSIRSSRACLVVAVLAVPSLVSLACQKGDNKGEPGSAAAPPATAPFPAAAAAAAAAAGPGAASGALGAGVVRGTVRFKGQAPPPREVTTPDPYCARQPIREEDLLAGAGGGLKNVLVHVVKGAGAGYGPPKTDAVVDQSGCMYRPRVQAVLVGQNVQIRNSDQTLHNVHTYKGASTIFNQAQIPGMGPMSHTFTTAGQIVKFRCDVHNWMTGYVAVVANPFFAVTGEDGAFSIDRLPAGTYTLEAWHERLGTRTAEVTIAEGQGEGRGQVVKVDFDFTAP